MIWVGVVCDDAASSAAQRQDMKEIEIYEQIDMGMQSRNLHSAAPKHRVRAVSSSR